MSREELEGLAGFSVLPGEAGVERLCGAADCAGLLMSDSQYEAQLLGRRLGWARSPEELERVWHKGLRALGAPESRNQEIYDRKRKQFGLQ